jgi:hypothetical protein
MEGGMKTQIRALEPYEAGIYRDDDLRKEALSQAVSALPVCNDEERVKRAELFYRFLKGEK